MIQQYGINKRHTSDTKSETLKVNRKDIPYNN